MQNYISVNYAQSYYRAILCVIVSPQVLSFCGVWWVEARIQIFGRGFQTHIFS